MPRRNGMGPMGMGPMTGWGRGYCGVRRYGARRMSYGYGRGFGRYDAWGDYPISVDEEKAILENEKTFLKSRLSEIEEILESFDE
ncbi:DUF5320 domain-containing protein [Clostridium sp. Cult2]|uniref:DUF5320 domain-containing protein n=1 Tax=Clostridium sp. Cult2 TaxID=2079003 RepID=UPI001F2C25C1|nr:DUF5320 domain-containing protein [Clostridium sp. Cult2]MCF6464373.1 hypothetical protein [Clostridium sp. Cult2]